MISKLLYNSIIDIISSIISSDMMYLHCINNVPFSVAKSTKLQTERSLYHYTGTFVL